MALISLRLRFYFGMCMTVCMRDKEISDECMGWCNRGVTVAND